jgi:hypothetical protein
MSAPDGEPGQNPLPPDGWQIPPTPPARPDAHGRGPAPRPGTNGLAIASLVCSIAGLTPYLGGLPAVLGIVLGIAALNQIKRAPQAGYGLAVAAIVVGVATLIIGLIWTIYAL